MVKRIGVIDAVAIHHEQRGFDPVDRILWRISLITKVLIILAGVLAVRTQDFFLIFSGVLALVFMLLPAFLERRMRIYLPVELDVTVTIFIFIHFAFGEMSNYYDTIWFDFFLHWTSGLVVALLGFLLIYTFLSTNRVKARPGAIILFTIALAMGMGATWEIFEFSMDQIFGFNMQNTGLVDTMWDLMATLIGAIIVSVSGYFYLRTPEKRRGIINRLVKKMHRNAQMHQK